MPVTDTTTDLESRSLTITARFEAAPARVWAAITTARAAGQSGEHSVRADVPVSPGTNGADA